MNILTGTLKKINRNLNFNLICNLPTANIKTRFNLYGNVIIAGNPSFNSNSGIVEVYSFNGSSATRLGDSFNGSSSTRLGYSVDINDLGDRIAIGSYGGGTTMYSWNGSSWSMMGSKITTVPTSGFFVAMNGTGDRVAIYGSGIVTVYSWDGSAWTKMGSSMSSSGAVAMDKSGDIIVTTGNGISSKIFKWNGSAWIQMSSPSITSTSTNSAHINSSGDKIILGYPNEQLAAGVIRIYSWNGTQWTQMGSNIIGDTSSIRAGWAVWYGPNNNVLILSKWGGSWMYGSTYTGSANIYSWDGSAWNKRGSVVGTVSNPLSPLSEYEGITMSYKGDMVMSSSSIFSLSTSLTAV